MYRAFPPFRTLFRIARYDTRDFPRAVGIARTRFFPARAEPIASAWGWYSSVMPCSSRIAGIRGSSPRSAMRTTVPMRGVSIKVRPREVRTPMAASPGQRFSSLRTRLKESPALPRIVPNVSTAIAGLKLRNPTMLASGFLDETGGTLLRVFKAGAGAVVTKSIGPEPRAGNTDPTIVDGDVGLLNAMGLPNPGMKAFGPEAKIALDGGAVVIGSVFGKDPDEYATVAKALQGYGVQAIELNLSCPHAKGLGTEIAEDPEAVREFTAAVKGKVTLPVMPKLSPNVSDIAEFARAAEDGGADAIVAINTLKAMAIAPEIRTTILANKVGGLSGPALRPVGVRCVYEIYEAVDVPIVGVGGVETGRDALEYVMAGARAVQIGTAIAAHGLDGFGEVTAGIRADMGERGGESPAALVGGSHWVA